MADTTVPQLTPSVNENKPIRVEFIDENTPAVRSDVLAAHFHRSHKNVLRDIAKLRSKCPESFRRLNFEPTLIDVPGPNGAVRQTPAYLLTRDGFSLLVMGFAGAEAVRWKLKYIEAFNALEAAVLENRAELARQAGYAQGLDEARALPAAKAERQAAYLSGMKEGKRLAERRDGLRLLTRAKGYLDKGLTKADAARCLGISRQYLRKLLLRATALGV